jgi:hypothetical protein
MEIAIVVLFGVTSFLAAALLFLAQPMIGKSVLPVLGGTPAVWNTCLMFFQATVLCGYILARALGVFPRDRRYRSFLQKLLFLAGLFTAAYIVQPIVLLSGSHWAASIMANPEIGLLGFLSSTTMLPLAACAVTAPLLQTWFSQTVHRRAGDPYFLYGSSNLGSLFALVAYPFAIEPVGGLNVQSHLWRIGFCLLAILVLACLVTTSLTSSLCPASGSALGSDRGVSVQFGHPHTGLKRTVTMVTVIRWIGLLFFPSSWLMGVTSYLTTDLAPIPLLWIIPLALFLLSFVIAFARFGEGAVRCAVRLLPYIIVPLVLVLSAGLVHIVWIPLHLLVFFVASVACHGALARLRPATEHLSAYYVTIAVGGLLGGLFNVLMAPVIFTRNVEYPLAIVFGCLAGLGFKIEFSSRNLNEWFRASIVPCLVFLVSAILITNQWDITAKALGVIAVGMISGLGLLTCVTARSRPLRFVLTMASVLVASSLTQGPSGRLLHAERNFFGVVKVTHDAELDANRLFHGSTLHGQQSRLPRLRGEPSTFFTRSGPIGQIFAMTESRFEGTDTQVAIVGLGVGTLAAYARPGENWTFYELDPAIERIARDPQLFTYLGQSKSEEINVVLGDARLRIASAPARSYQLIILDAFSSDAVPVHLLSREALKLYREKLAEKGLLVFNLSNRYLDLDPVIARQASDGGWACRVRYDLHVNDEERVLGKQPSIWAVMAASEHDLGELATDNRWRIPVLRRASQTWTDDYSSLVDYLLLSPGRFWNREKTRAVPDNQRTSPVHAP